jgi:hypothetical protein
MIRDIIGGNLFQIDTVKKYPADYNKCTQAAQNEKNAMQKFSVDYPSLVSKAPLPWIGLKNGQSRVCQSERRN